MEKRFLAMWIWLCLFNLKVKIAHFRLPSASQKRACLSSLLTTLSWGKRTWGPFLEATDGSFKSFENNKVKLSAKETKWTSLEVRTLPRPQLSLIASLIILRRDARAGAGGDGKAKRSSFSFPLLPPIIPCLISLPKLTPAPFRYRETTGDESGENTPYSSWDWFQNMISDLFSYWDFRETGPGVKRP